MPKDFTYEWRSILTLTAIGVLVIAPSIFKGIPSSNDLRHHYRVATSFYDSISKGNLYPGWNAKSTNGYGDVSFRFYPPLVYYLLSGCRGLAGTWYDGSLLFFALVSVGGGLGVYFWARTLLSCNQAMWAGLFYLIAPYHVNQIYQAFLLAEYAGSSILPFAFAFTELVCRRGRVRDILGLSISWALLILTHVPLTVIGSIALFIYALLRMQRANAYRTMLRLALAVMLALAASAFYWVTMVAELGWMAGSRIDSGLWFDYRYNFLFWKTVDGSTTWWADILGVATLTMFLPGLALKRSWQGRVSANGLKAVGLLAAFAFIMALPVSEPLWRLCPPLQRIEFPWRWLAVASMTGSVLVASTTVYWRDLARAKARSLVLLAASCIILPLALTLSQTVRGATYIPRPQFESLASTVAESDSLPIWLPIWVTKGWRRMPHEIEAGHRSLAIDSWEPEHRTFRVGSGATIDARVRTFYYPYWTAMADGKKLAVRPDTDGAILISLPEDDLSVTLEFHEPARRELSMYISLLAWGLIVSGFIFFSWVRKKTTALDDDQIGSTS